MLLGIGTTGPRDHAGRCLPPTWLTTWLAKPTRVRRLPAGHGVRQHQWHVEGEEHQHPGEEGQLTGRRVVEHEHELEDPGDHDVGQQRPSEHPVEHRPGELLDAQDEDCVHDEQHGGQAEQDDRDDELGWAPVLGGHHDSSGDDQGQRRDADGHDRREVGLTEVLGVGLAEPGTRWQHFGGRAQWLARNVMMRMVRICRRPVIPAV